MKTNIKTIALGFVLTAGVGMTFTGCNSSEDVAYSLPSSATIRSFSLSPNANILPNLDSVYFSIDLDNLNIYNADSLPYGTKVTALTPVITTESASVVELLYTDEEGKEATLNYLENTSDTIDFSKPVKVRVVSYDSNNERTYTVKVNVHQQPVDSMAWTRLAGASLPTPFTVVNEQKTTKSPAGTFYCMTSYQSEYAFANSTDPASTWDIVRQNLPFVPLVSSLTATNDALYVLDAAGQLYKSEDKGANWSATGDMATSLIGAYGNVLLATTNTGSQWKIKEIPGNKEIVAPIGFPVMNTSTPVTLTFEMATNPQMIVVGGRKADGTLTPDTWGFDGSNWANITRRGLPESLENVSVAPYFDLQSDTTSWKVSTKSTILVAMYGNRQSGTINDTVYMSSDFGMTWKKAPDMMQIPAKVIPSRTKAQLYPHTGVAYAASTKVKLPAVFKSCTLSWSSLGYEIPALRHTAIKKISAPITQWDVPYLYLFGGVSADGATYKTIYRGAILGLTYKPLE